MNSIGSMAATKRHIASKVLNDVSKDELRGNSIFKGSSTLEGPSAMQTSPYASK